MGKEGTATVTYKYTARAKNGEKVSGVIEAYNEIDAMERIRRTCDVVEKITPMGADKKRLMDIQIGGNKINDKAFTLMCSQFAIILGAGIPVARTVRLIAAKTSDKNLKRILNQVGDDVEGGRSMSASFSDRGGGMFPDTFIETVRAGEETGSINKSFETMHEHYDKVLKLKKRIKGAMAYPAFVLTLAVIVVIILMIKVVPTFMESFEGLGVEMPALTKALIAVSDFFQNYIIHLVVGITAIVLAFKIYSGTDSGRMKIAEMTRGLPLAGNVSILTSATQFTNSMSTMLGAGLPMVRALNITARTISNAFVSKKITEMAQRVEEGRPVGATLKETATMPDILVDMVTVGEASGEMEDTLKTIGAYYDVELDSAISATMAKLEPAIMVGLAAVVGFIVIAIYGAMFDIYGAM